MGKKEQQYIQLKTELKDCIRDRNNLNTFTITTFVAVLGLAYKYASDQPYFFLIAQIFMIPVLWRIMNHKRTEYRLSKVIQDKFGDPWETKRSESNTFYFEFLTLSLFVTAITVYFLIKALCNIMICPVVCVIGSLFCVIASFGVTAVIFFLSYKSSQLTTKNCDDKWCELLFNCDKSKQQPKNHATAKASMETNNIEAKSEGQTENSNNS